MRKLFALVLLSAVMCVSARAADNVETLLPYLPGDMNVVAVIRAQDIMQSPRAIREKWAERQEHEFLAGAATLPPWATTMVRGIAFHPGARDLRSFAVVQSNRSIDMALVAEHERAQLQTISGRPVVRSPRNCFFVQLAPELLGVVSPAFRQDAARWIQQVQNPARIALSPFLQSAASDETSQVTVALDTEELLEPERIRARIAASEVLQAKPDDQPPVVNMLSKLRGIIVNIRVTDETQAELRFEFSEPVGRETEFLKPLFAEFLNDAGISIDEVQTAEVQAAAQTVTLRSVLSDESLRRIGALLLTPHATDAPIEKAEAPTTPRTQVSLDRTRRYFRSVGQIIDDLARANSRTSDIGRTATWHDTFADRIDRLSTVGVEPSVQEFAHRTSDRLRALGASLRGAAVDVNILQKTVTYNVNVTPGWGYASWWGEVGYQPSVVNVESNLREVREQQAQAVMAGADKRNQIWQLIVDDRAEVRRQLEAASRSSAQ